MAARTGPAPALIDFLGAYPGSSEGQFRGGSIGVVAALIYGDGIRIQWRMRPPPDLSWVEPATSRAQRLREELRQSPEFVEAQRDVDRLKALWA